MVIPSDLWGLVLRLEDMHGIQDDTGRHDGRREYHRGRREALWDAACLVRDFIRDHEAAGE